MSELTGEIFFWLALVMLNNLLFVPNYFLYKDQADVYPFIGDIKKNGYIGLTSSLNMDPFRFALDWTFLVALSRLVYSKEVAPILAAYYLLIFFFNIYQHGFRKIYHFQPNLFNDGKLVLSAAAILWHESKLKLIGGILISVAVSLLVFRAVTSFLEYYPSQEGLVFWFPMALFIILGLLSIRNHGFVKQYPNDLTPRYHWVAFELIDNVLRSIKHYKKSQRKIGAKFNSKRKVAHFQLNSRPNIHFLFIESYGSVYYQHHELASRSFNRWFEAQRNLESSGFGVRSTFSNSTTVSGQSWLTYSSFFQGFRIDDNSDYENYLKDGAFNSADNLISVLKRHGYTHYHLNPIRPIKGIEVPFEALNRFFSIDRWILDADLDYHGKRYGFGECAPDQFAMNYAMQLIREEKPDPYVFFYLTKNSHSPFIHPEMMVDWQKLNNPNYEGDHFHHGFLKQPKLSDYESAIGYQLDNVSDFILNHGKDNDIFWVMGDHQPPMIARREEHGTSTPVHVISKDSYFLHQFEEYGFLKELALGQNLKHEALYSVFLRSLIKSYGAASELPAYEPNGLQL